MPGTGCGRCALTVIVLSIVVLPALVGPAAAHQHPRAAVRETLAAASRDSARGDSATEEAPSHVGPTPSKPFMMPPMREAILEHLHNKIVHFPLALGLAAALFLLVGRRRPEVEDAGRWLVWLAALGGVAAYVSGRAQKEAFEGEPKEWLADLHGNWGLATAIALAAWALITLWKPARRHAWLWGLVVATLVLITGFYGGIVAHGE